MLGVRNEFLIAAVHDPVHVFKRDLADDVWQLVRDFYDIKPAAPALDFERDRGKNFALFYLGGHGSGFDLANGTKAKLSDDGRLEVKFHGTGIHQSFSL